MKTNKNEELQSRREFFKSAAKAALPIMAISVLGTSFLTSCGDGHSSSVTCDCYGGCDGGCSNNCDGLCGGDCWAYCESKAKS